MLLRRLRACLGSGAEEGLPEPLLHTAGMSPAARNASHCFKAATLPQANTRPTPVRGPARLSALARRASAIVAAGVLRAEREPVGGGVMAGSGGAVGGKPLVDGGSSKRTCCCRDAAGGGCGVLVSTCSCSAKEDAASSLPASKAGSCSPRACWAASEALRWLPVDVVRM